MNYINIAKRVIEEEAFALKTLAQNINEDFERLVEYIANLQNRIIVTGIGKSGYIARKIAASFSSTGATSFYIHPAEASHGDLGMITNKDLVLILSKSGETQELIDIVNYCKRFDIKIASITMMKNSFIARSSNFLLLLPEISEASSVTAPTTSTLMMLALGDAITVAVQEVKGFNKENFHIFHPGGKIGANLLQVKNLMRKDNQLPLVTLDTSFTNTILIMNQKSLGCALVVDDKMHLIGIITDGDLRRHIHKELTNKTAADVMSLNPKNIDPTIFAAEALFIMNDKSLTTLPIVEAGRLVGIVHIHDLLRAGVDNEEKFI